LIHLNIFLWLFSAATASDLFAINIPLLLQKSSLFRSKISHKNSCHTNQNSFLANFVLFSKISVIESAVTKSHTYLQKVSWFIKKNIYWLSDTEFRLSARFWVYRRRFIAPICKLAVMLWDTKKNDRTWAIYKILLWSS
jgi:hypothetical protein